MEVQPSTATRTALPDPDLCDAYAMQTSRKMSVSEIAGLIFQRTPLWVKSLMAARNLLMKPFGLKTSVRHLAPERKRFGMFPVLQTGPNHLVLGLDDKHLDFRIVLEVQPVGDGTASLVTLGTNVKCHNTLGHVYLAVVKPFHRRIAQAMLAQVV